MYYKQGSKTQNRILSSPVVQCSTVTQCVVPKYIECSIPKNSVVLCSAVQYSAVSQYVVWCRTVQYSRVQYPNM